MNNDLIHPEHETHHDFEAAKMFQKQSGYEILNTIKFDGLIFSRKELEVLLNLFICFDGRGLHQILSNFQTLIYKVIESGNDINRHIDVLMLIINPNSKEGSNLWSDVIIDLCDKIDSKKTKKDKDYENVVIYITDQICENKSIKAEDLYDKFLVNFSLSPSLIYITEFYLKIFKLLKSRIKNQLDEENIKIYVKFIKDLRYDKEYIPNELIPDLLIEINIIETKYPIIDYIDDILELKHFLMEKISK